MAPKPNYVSLYLPFEAGCQVSTSSNFTYLTSTSTQLRLHDLRADSAMRRTHMRHLMDLQAVMLWILPLIECVSQS